MRLPRPTHITAALATAGFLALSVVTPSMADSQTKSDSSYYPGNDYWASMTMTTKANFSSNKQIAYQQDGVSRGGVSTDGPYDSYGVQAKLLKHRWDIILDATGTQDCSIGFPSGFTCTIVASLGGVRGTKIWNIGASKPTSTDLPQKSYAVKGGAGQWMYIQFDSEWTTRMNIDGTVVERIVGNTTRHLA